MADSWAAAAAVAGVGAAAAAGRTFSSDPRYNGSAPAAILRMQQDCPSQVLLYRSVSGSPGSRVSSAAGAGAKAAAAAAAISSSRDSGDLRHCMESKSADDLPGDWQLLHEEHELNQFAAVGLFAGDQLVAVLSLAGKGPVRPANWTPEALHCAVGLMSPHLRRAQAVLASAPISALHAAATLSDVVIAAAEAAVDVAAAVVHVRGSGRVAFMGEDLAAAAIFQQHQQDVDAAAATTLLRARRSSCDYVPRRSYAGVSGNSLTPRSAITAMAATPMNVMTAAAAAGTHPGLSLDAGIGVGGDRTISTTATNTSTATNAIDKTITSPDSLRRESWLPQPSVGPLPSFLLPSNKGASCKGHTLMLHRTLLGEALSKQVAGLCIDDCQAYMMTMKAYPRDLLLSRGAIMPLSLALAATSADSPGPGMALYVTYGTSLSRPLLQTVVRELQQLLQALLPIITAKLTGDIQSEYDYLSAQLQASHSHRTTKPSGPALLNSAENVPSDASEEPQSFPPNKEKGDNNRLVSFLLREGLGSNVAASSCGGEAAGGGAGSMVAAGEGPARGSPGAADAAGDERLATVLASNPPAASVHGHTHAVGRPPPGRSSSSQNGADGAGAALPKGDVVGQPQARVAGSAGAGGAGVEAPLSPLAAGAAAEDVAVAALEGDIDMEFAARRRVGLSSLVADGVGKLRCSSMCGAGCSGVGVGEPGGGARLRSRLGAARSVSFRLEAAQAPRGASKLAPIIASMHDRLRAAQAVQMTFVRSEANRTDLRSLKLLQEIGQGGYGIVYRGTFHGTEVAVKLIQQSRLAGVHSSSNVLASSAGLGLHKQNLHDAIELVASVSMSHINIVQVPAYFMDVRLEKPDGFNPLDSGDHPTDSQPFRLVQQPSLLESPGPGQETHHGDCALALVLEYCDCGSLCDAILNRRFIEVVPSKKPAPGSGCASTATPGKTYLAINMRSVYATLLEIALALRHMHSLALVHCDLKPQNVLLKSSPRDPRGFTAKLSDFGLAKMMAHDDQGQLVIDEAVASGTITHVAPEVLQAAAVPASNKALGAAVDIYAFGILMHQMLCGMKVYDRSLSASAIAHAVAHRFMRPQLPSWVPQSYRSLAQACWNQLPSARPTADELVRHLEQALEAKRGTGGTATSAAATAASAAAAATNGANNGQPVGPSPAARPP